MLVAVDKQFFQIKKKNLYFFILAFTLMQFTEISVFIYNVYQQRQTQNITRARGRIQSTNFMALKRAGLLTPAEIQAVEDEWKDAKYDFEFDITENPNKEK